MSIKLHDRHPNITLFPQNNQFNNKKGKTAFTTTDIFTKADALTQYSRNKINKNQMNVLCFIFLFNKAYLW